jgi:HPt (histidine-containing phosphotransfer) domain-containing protein
MFDNFGQLEFNLASLVSGVVGVVSCWLVQRMFAPPVQQISPSPRFAETNTWLSPLARQKRAAEDELVLRWLNEQPEACAQTAPPELALQEIASELLPFNPIAVRFVNKVTESDMTAAVERIEQLLASVDPPESLGIMTNAAASGVRDPQGRLNSQPEEPQRRRSDQAIIYDALLRRCLGDHDFAHRMLNKFPARCRLELESLEEEIQRGTWPSATRRINQLRGMAANIAAENLREALANLEQVCRQEAAPRAAALLEAVQCEFQQVLTYLDQTAKDRTAEPPADENKQPSSRWSAALFDADEQTPPSLELQAAGRAF